MKAAAKLLAVAGCLALLFGFLALDFIPSRIVASVPSGKQFKIDHVLEVEWALRGLYSIAAGAAALVVALILGITGRRRDNARQVQSR